MKRQSEVVLVATVVCFGAAAAGFAFAIYRQNMLEIGFCSTPRLAILAGAMVGGMVLALAAMLMESPFRRATPVISVGALIGSLLSLFLMRPK